MILVTGGAGYIGSHVVNRLSERGKTVIVYDNLSTGFPDALIHGEKFIIADLSDYSALSSVMQKYPITSVMHFAASVVVPESLINPIKYYTNNTVNTLNLLRACVQHNIKQVIYSSTAAVYGHTTSGMASEETPACPLSPYGNSKWLGEKILSDISAAHDIRFVCLRYFNVAGADPEGRLGQRNPKATHLIKIACEAALHLRNSVSIFGTHFPTPDGSGVRDYIHVEDVASAHIAALHYLESGQPSVTLNVGYGAGASVKEIIRLVKEVSGENFPVIDAPPRAGDPVQLIAQADRIRRTLNWTPQFNDLRKIITDAWRWEKVLNSTAALV